nr:hypothetical protein [Tanacetum cinerariifolium]
MSSMDSLPILDLGGCSSLLQFVFNEYGIKNMILHTENSFLSLLFITSKKGWIRRIGLHQYGVLGCIFLNQNKYALESLKKYGMETCEPADTPMVEKSKLDEDPQGKVVDPTCYREMIGTPMYLTSSRSDLVFAVCMCAQYQAKPTKKHDSCIVLTAFADADHVGCLNTIKSTSRSMQLLGDRLVNCSLMKQKSTTISSTEAEYVALTMVLCSTTYLCTAIIKVSLLYVATMCNTPDSSI